MTTTEDQYRDRLHQAFGVMQEMRARIEELEQGHREPIAVVGMGCRFPGGVDGPDSYWDLLRDGVDAVSEVPEDRWPIDRHFDPDRTKPGKTYTRWGGFLDGIDRFDPSVFGILPREVPAIDPQHRLFLEVAWEALEYGGHAPDRLGGSRTGVFVGLTLSEYLIEESRSLTETDIGGYHTSGGVPNVAAGRLSYLLGLRGPSMAVDTACSSSLTALHLACQSLRTGDSDMALAGGVNALVIPDTFISFSKWGMMAADGRCKTFDASADGMVRSEGCGVVVLKRASDAVADGDNVLALIRGTALNQDGASGGLSVPNGPAQEDVIRAALEDAGVAPAEVDYVEAHGTGTSLGDPIEVEALARTVGVGRTKDGPLIIGSAKTNLGHLESAAGMAGFIKTVLCLRNGEIPGNLHFSNPSPHIDWDLAPIEVPTSLRPWPTGTDSRIAGVSAFGFSGTNAHVIVEAPPAKQAATPEPVSDSPVSSDPSSPNLLTMSAGTAEALEEMASNLVGHLKNSDAVLADVCATANTGRSRMRHRLAVVAESVDGLSTSLERYVETGTDTSVHRDVATHQRARPVFLFTGQGAQSVGMGQALYDSEPVFARAMDRCANILSEHLDVPLLDILYPSDDSSATAGLLDNTSYAQPAIFSLGWALSELWKSWGITPAAVVGHSVGELAAACIAGVFSLEDGLRLVAARGRLMGSLPSGGSMFSIAADEQTVARILADDGGEVAIAAVNGNAVTISGAEAEVKDVADRCGEAGIEATELVVSHAFHSSLMDPILDEFKSIAEAVTFRAPTLPVVSGLTGKPASSKEITTARYWRDHIRQPVRFGDAIDWLAANDHSTFVEVGPHPVLSAMVNGLLTEPEVAVLPSLRRNHDDRTRMLAGLASLHVRGAEVDWVGFHQTRPGRPTPLPTYPFQRQRFWFQPSGSRPTRRLADDSGHGHPVLGRRLRSPVHTDIVFEGHVDRQAVDYLDDHEINGRIILPGAAYLELAMAVGRRIMDSPGDTGVEAPDGISLIDVAFEQPLDATDDPSEIQVVVSDPEGDVRELQIHGFNESTETWTLHATGRLTTNRAPAVGSAVSEPVGQSPAAEDWSRVRARCTTEVSPSAVYASLRSRGINFGPTFLAVRQLWQTAGEAIAEIELPESVDRNYTMNYHPAAIDAGFLPLSLLLPEGEQTYVPLAVGRFKWNAPLPRRLFSHATVSGPVAGGLVRGDVRLLDEDGAVLATLTDVTLAPFATTGPRRSPGAGDSAVVRTDWTVAPLEGDLEPSAAAGSWLVVTDREEPAVTATVERLRRQGDTVVTVDVATVTTGGDLTGLVAAKLNELPASLTGVVHAVGTGHPVGRVSAAGPNVSTSRDIIDSLLVVAQQLSDVSTSGTPRLWVVTRGAQAVAEGDPVDIVGGAVSGLARTIDAEHPEWRTTTIDLSPHPQVGERDALWAELAASDRGDGETETAVAVRNGNRLVARLSPHNLAAEDPGNPVQLTMASRGTLTDLALGPAPTPVVGPKDVVIDVRSTGMNFRDVLKALDMYPDSDVIFGEECAGIVTEVGTSVERFTPGDQVFGLAYGSCASQAVADESLLLSKPAGLGFDTVATLPIAFVTAHHALHHRAELAGGEHILIHSAAGGVGQAAVQLAKAAGATVLATAGSPEKRDHLRAMGVDHVFDSRTLDFADQILEVTDGRGVDVVLNSLSGEFVDASVAALSPSGRFLEMGKLGVWDEARFLVARPAGQFHEIYPDHLYRDQPGVVRSILSDVLTGLSDGSLGPIPTQRFPLTDAVEAFRFMRSAGHIGKIVLTQPAPRAGSVVDRIRPDGAYLVTGGFGGIGLLVADWLARSGATKLVLMGRSAPGPDAEAALGKLAEQGVTVTRAFGDVSNAEDVAAVLRASDDQGTGLAGIFHVAGLNDDGTLHQQDWSRFEAVLAPKLDGAMELHRQTLDAPPELFVVFSSASALLGSPGQANYATANAAVDAFAHWRSSLDLPTLSVNWGPWDDVGMTAALDSADVERLNRSGFRSIEPALAFETLGSLPWPGPPQLGVLPVNEHFVAGRPMLSGLETQRSPRSSSTEETPTGSTAKGSLTAEVLATPAGGRRNLIRTRILGLIKVVFGLVDQQVIDDHQPLGEAGMDSLAAVELRNALSDAVGQTLPATVTFDHPTVDALVTFVESLIVDADTDDQPAGDDPVTTDQRAEQDRATQDTAEVLAMSDEDAELLLLAELEGKGGA